jgi:FkbM family methyltransferase
MAPRVWIDVGAHLGEKTFAAAEADPSLRVYAFEPNLSVARRLIGRLPNYVVLPMAVAEHDGCADLYVNTFAAASSLLPFDAEGLRQWAGGEVLNVEKKIAVPTVRLDTFMGLMGLDDIEFLKIDAQGADFAVVRSASGCLRAFARIALEVQVNAVPLYQQGSDRRAVVAYLEDRGFELASVEKQSRDQEENLVFVRKDRGADEV